MTSKMEFQLDRIQIAVKEFLEEGDWKRKGLETYVLAQDCWFKITVERDDTPGEDI